MTDGTGFHFYPILCALVFAYVYVCVKVLDPLELELKEIESYHVGVRIESGFSGRAAHCSFFCFFVLFLFFSRQGFSV